MFGLCVTGGLLLLGGLLIAEARSARVRRFHPAVGFYLAGVAAGVVGTLLGAAMVTGRDGIRDAHVIVNLFGLVGLVIAGTLPFFTATQARMKMSGRATAGRMHAILAVLIGGVAAAGIGSTTGHPIIVAAGLGGYAGALVYLGSVLPRPRHKQLDWAGPRLVQLALGGIWWITIVGVAAVRAAIDVPVLPERALIALVVGGYAQILVASLAYLGPVLRGGGHVKLSAGFALTRSRVSLVAGNLAALAWVLGTDRLAIVGVAVLAADVAGRAIRLGYSGKSV
jgi:hypothetical protein